MTNERPKMTSVAHVSEIVFTIQFPRISIATVLDMANFFELRKDKFPLLQQVPRLGPIDPKMPELADPSQMQLGFTDASLPRVWLISSDGMRVIQLQDDRLGFNWRRVDPLDRSDPYPGYVALKQEFADLYAEFSSWCENRFGAAPKPNAGDLSYTNAIPLQDEKGPKRISEILSFFSPRMKRQINGFQMGWMERLSGKAPGYLTMQATVGALVTGPSVVVLNFVSRVDLKDAGNDVSSWFDNAHNQTLELFSQALISGTEC